MSRFAVCLTKFDKNRLVAIIGKEIATNDSQPNYRRPLFLSFFIEQNVAFEFRPVTVNDCKSVTLNARSVMIRCCMSIMITNNLTLY